MSFFGHELRSFDFVDLDEESVSQIAKSNSFETIPMLTPKLSEAVFIRSASPKGFQGKASVQEISTTNPDETISFDRNSSCIEGRDSRIYCGDLLRNGIFVCKVAVKSYNSDTDSLAGAVKEQKVVQLVEGKRGFVKCHHVESQLSVWDWMAFGSLDKCLLKRPELPTEGIIVNIAKCIQIIHQNHIVHHDIKPHNILVSEAGEAHLIDFGDAKLDCPACLPIDEGIGLGTLAYTAPELLTRTSQVYDPYAADIYSFGATAYYILFGGKVDPWEPFFPSRAVQLILYVQKGFFAGEFNPKLPQDHPYTGIIEKCLDLNPGKRPTIDEIVSKLSNK